MEFQRTRYGYALKIEPGEEIFTTLQAFAQAHSLKAGAILGLGAVGETELGFFVPATRSYVRQVFTGDHEIGSLQLVDQGSTASRFRTAIW
jgi:predicted DNA-binding protein with PD1-like motif